MSVKKTNSTAIFSVLLLVVSVVFALGLTFFTNGEFTAFYLMKDVPVYFHIDALGKWFITIVSIVWVSVGLYSMVYMKHEGGEKRFYIFYLLLYWVLIGLNAAGNLVTMYMFYEFMTLISFPLVMHSGSKEAIMASLKYLFYSMCGAYMGLFGILQLNRYCESLKFVPGGTLLPGAAGQNMFYIAVFVMILGFGVKAGMLPFHSWLPTAHPVAPSPASAVLSAIIVKAGVLAIIRVIYYLVGPFYLTGTWVQYTLMTLALITVFMGSLLAYREKVFKKRLAYSTVSQVSYILFGLFVMTQNGFTGAMLHVCFHAFVKCGLFLTAGIFLVCLNKTKVDELIGVGKRMPYVLSCYTIFALALIGIPPTSGFISKWYLAEGALCAHIGVFRYLGPAVLLISALLTAGYLLPITMRGFFPGEHGNGFERKEPPKLMLIPLIILAVLAVLCGVFPNFLTGYVGEIAGSIF